MITSRRQLGLRGDSELEQTHALVLVGTWAPPKDPIGARAEQDLLIAEAEKLFPGP